MHPQLGVSYEVGVKAFDFEIINRSRSTLLLNARDLSTRSRARDNRSANADFARPCEAATFDVKRMLARGRDV